jgi:hypothetical protein
VPRLSEPHPPVDRRARRATAPHTRLPRLQSQPRLPAPRVDRPHQYPGPRSVAAKHSASAPVREDGPVRDRGLGLLIMFTAGVLVMVALISLTAIIGSWWMLAPVMVIDFAVTAGVLAIIVRLLGD